MSPGERIVQYFSIYPKMSIQKGENTILLSAIEHYNSYQYILGKKTKELTIRVE